MDLQKFANEIQATEKVLAWGESKNLMHIEIAKGQFIKVYEEVFEVLSAIKNKDLFELEDGIGDVKVTTIILKGQLGVDISLVPEETFNELFNDGRDEVVLPEWVLLESLDAIAALITRKGELSSDDKVKISEYTLFMDLALEEISRREGLNKTVLECLFTAYNVIAGRKGLTINGIFVKEKDITDKMLEESGLTREDIK